MHIFLLLLLNLSTSFGSNGEIESINEPELKWQEIYHRIRALKCKYNNSPNFKKLARLDFFREEMTNLRKSN
jgi:hypothetical protein